jgi:predicted acetyltransferase
MRMSALQLIRPQIEHYPSYASFIEEMRAAGEKIWENHVPAEHELPSQFVQRLLDAEHSARDGLVTESYYWGFRHNQVVGRICLRHYLNENLKEFGGHIGYEVRPSARNQGVAREMLRLVLATPKAKEIGKLLLTCAPTNLASIRTIIANGGVLTATKFVERWQRDTSYYWIELS